MVTMIFFCPRVSRISPQSVKTFNIIDRFTSGRRKDGYFLVKIRGNVCDGINTADKFKHPLTMAE